MGSYKFLRWDNALKQCMDAKKKGAADAKANRWKGDPLLLNQEAHELPPEKQREALDMAEEASPELRTKLAPMWKYCFVQWHVYDAGLEAIEKNQPLRDGLNDPLLLKDVDALKAFSESGELQKAKTAEKWTWELLEPHAPAGTIQPWNEATAAPLLKVGRAERREGVAAFAQGHYARALEHFCRGLRLVARAPAVTEGPQAKLRGDLYKNKAAAALKLQMKRTALRAADCALAIDGQDPKAWYRKSCALQALGRTEESRSALSLAGVGEAPQEVQGGPVLTLRDNGPGLGFDYDTTEVEELYPRYHPTLEQIVFAEVGIDSVVAVDMVMHIQAELRDVPIPLTLVFDCPTVVQAVAVLLERLQAGDDPRVRAKLNVTVWRAMCRALGSDPVQGIVEGRLGHVKWPEYSEEEATAVLQELKRAYEEPAFVQQVRAVAKRAAFEQRAFLVRLRPLALEVQRPVLKARGFSPDAQGLQWLECAVISAALKSTAVSDLLRSVRIAQQGGPNGMWAVHMEPDEEAAAFADSSSMQCKSTYLKADPFGPGRKNTNSVMGRAVVA